MATRRYARSTRRYARSRPRRVSYARPRRYAGARRSVSRRRAPSRSSAGRTIRIVVEQAQPAAARPELVRAMQTASAPAKNSKF